MARYSPNPNPNPNPHWIFDGKVRPEKDGSKAAFMIPPYKSNHASTIEVLPDGTLAAAWFSGDWISFVRVVPSL